VPYDLHIVRSETWLDAAKSPITKQEIDTLIGSDRELKWSSRDYLDQRDPKTGAVVRYWAILWDGHPCFLWMGGEVRCSSPEERQIRKMLAMAKALHERVVGDDDEQYELRRSIFGAEKIAILRR
jgi:hypothetical protein